MPLKSKTMVGKEKRSHLYFLLLLKASFNNSSELRESNGREGEEIWQKP
jgi:hypothetical protein